MWLPTSAKAIWKWVCHVGGWGGGGLSSLDATNIISYNFSPFLFFTYAMASVHDSPWTFIIRLWPFYCRREWMYRVSSSNYKLYSQMCQHSRIILLWLLLWLFSPRKWIRMQRYRICKHICSYHYQWIILFTAMTVLHAIQIHEQCVWPHDHPP